MFFKVTSVCAWDKSYLGDNLLLGGRISSYPTNLTIIQCLRKPFPARKSCLWGSEEKAVMDTVLEILTGSSEQPPPMLAWDILSRLLTFSCLSIHNHSVIIVPIILLHLLPIYLDTYVWVCEYHCAPVEVSWKLWELVLSTNHVCPGGQTQVLSFGGKHLHPLSHFLALLFWFLLGVNVQTPMVYLDRQNISRLCHQTYFETLFNQDIMTLL